MANGHNPSAFHSEVVAVPAAGSAVRVFGGGHTWGQTNVRVRNNGSVTVFLGGPGVTPGNGFPLKSGEMLLFERVSMHSELHACQATPSSQAAEVRVLRRDV